MDTTGLKWAPLTGANIRMIANSPAAVAAAFSVSRRPVSPGESRCAAIPDPITSAASSRLPRYSANSLRGNGTPGSRTTDSVLTRVPRWRSSPALAGPCDIGSLAGSLT
ncbi:MAG TPA: hypothetical protein VF892_00495, partial [Pseudonocardiaceae bacterium]